MENMTLAVALQIVGATLVAVAVAFAVGVVAAVAFVGLVVFVAGYARERASG